jgi:hypothetical protein
MRVFYAATKVQKLFSPEVHKIKRNPRKATTSSKNGRKWAS